MGAGEGDGALSATARATSFGGVAESYERGRPTYPTPAAAWLVTGAGGDGPGESRRVLELGAGTGKLTRELLGLGHDVIATDPDPAMLEVLEREVPGAVTALGTAEDIEVPDQSVDVVVAGQCFHWFDVDHALPEIARVLRPGGRLALVWNERDTRVPWVRRLGALLGATDVLRDPTAVLEGSGLFVDITHAEFKHRQHLDPHTIQDLVRSYSATAVLDAAGREMLLSDVMGLYGEYGRGMDGMLLPWFTRCFSAEVVEVVLTHDEPAPTADASSDGFDPVRDTMPRALRGKVRPAGPADLPLQSEIDDSQMILIDFR